MCGAFSILAFREFEENYDLSHKAYSFSPRYNARPGQRLPVILNTDPKTIQPVLWGFVPHWDKAKPIINARKESLDTKVTFDKSFRERRCLIPADGFYEWGIVNGKKLPFRFILKTHKIFAFAGIWHQDPKTEEPEFAIITTEPNSLVAKVHDRMPAILPKNRELDWLRNDLHPELLLNLLEPFPANLMEAYPVSTLVNSPQNDSAYIIKKIKI